MDNLGKIEKGKSITDGEVGEISGGKSKKPIEEKEDRELIDFLRSDKGKELIKNGNRDEISSVIAVYHYINWLPVLIKELEQKDFIQFLERVDPGVMEHFFTEQLTPEIFELLINKFGEKESKIILDGFVLVLDENKKISSNLFTVLIKGLDEEKLSSLLNRISEKALTETLEQLTTDKSQASEELRKLLTTKLGEQRMEVLLEKVFKFKKAEKGKGSKESEEEITIPFGLNDEEGKGKGKGRKKKEKDFEWQDPTVPPSGVNE